MVGETQLNKQASPRSDEARGGACSGHAPFAFHQAIRFRHLMIFLKVFVGLPLFTTIKLQLLNTDGSFSVADSNSFLSP